MRSIACWLALLLALGVTAAARADTYRGFVLNGTLQDGGTLSGGLYVDTTNGGFQLVDVTVSDGGYTYVFNAGPSDDELLGSPPSGLYTFFEYYLDGSLTPYSLNLVFPEASLIDYQGGSLCTIDTPCAGLISSYFDSPTEDYFTTLTAVPTPEPAALSMMFTGVAVLGLCMVRPLRCRARRMGTS